MNTKEAQIKAFEALEAADVEAALAIKAASAEGESCFDDTTRGRMEAMLDPTFQPKAFAGANISPGVRICAAALELWGAAHRLRDRQNTQGCVPNGVSPGVMAAAQKWGLDCDATSCHNTHATMDDESPRPPRRKRYKGKNPRRFEEKYKEHDPERYAETVAKVIATGKTPAGSHVPILVDECRVALALEPGMTGVDGTLGYGGHALRILETISPGGKLIGLDQDPIELPKTEARIRNAGFSECEFEARRSNYAGIAKVLNGELVDFIFADLGCSSMQFDDPTRGFSFKHQGPLDMRMNPNRGLSAAEWLLKVSPEKLELALHQNSDEPRAETIASALAGRSFLTTLDLADAVRAVAPLDEVDAQLTIRRVFQAIRIAVNEEFVALDAFLRVLPNCLKPGGRVAVLTFHSGEDRRVKKAFQAGLRDGVFSEISAGVITAGPEERRMNPRSTPAKLRWAIK